MSEPIFIIRCGDVEYRIWGDGHIAGFPDGAIVVNRIADELADAYRQGMHDQAEEAK